MKKVFVNLVYNYKTEQYYLQLIFPYNKNHYFVKIDTNQAELMRVRDELEVVEDTKID